MFEAARGQAGCLIPPSAACIPIFLLQPRIPSCPCCLHVQGFIMMVPVRLGLMECCTPYHFPLSARQLPAFCPCGCLLVREPACLSTCLLACSCAACDHISCCLVPANAGTPSTSTSHTHKRPPPTPQRYEDGKLCGTLRMNEKGWEGLRSPADYEALIHTHFPHFPSACVPQVGALQPPCCQPGIPRQAPNACRQACYS